MNKLIRYLVTLATFGAVTASIQAQPAPKILVVDMAKALDSYYKYQESTAKLKESGQKAQEQLDQYNKEMQALADQYKDLMEKSKNTAMFSAEVRTQAESDAQKKMQEFQQRQADAQRFANNTRASLQQRAKNYNDILLEDIKNSASNIARIRGATLVLDKGGPSLIGVPTVIYADPAYDITDEVLKDVNKDRPVTPPAESPAAPAATPVAPGGEPTQFSVPNVTPPAQPADKKP